MRALKCSFAFLCILLSCCRTNNDRNESLRLSKELSKVIEHYQRPEDSLKLKAVYFLINNMDHYGSIVGPGVENNLAAYRDIRNTPPAWRDSVYGVYRKTRNMTGPVSAEMDLNNIKAEYLINNIDLAFKAWEESPWSKNYHFKMFCEYVLPYRISNEKITRWREYIINENKDIFSTIRYDGGSKYEFEDATISRCKVIDEPYASNQKAVLMDGRKSSSVTLSAVHCGPSREKTIAFKYTNGAADAQASLFINNKEVRKIDFPGTGTWKPHQADYLISSCVKIGI